MKFVLLALSLTGCSFAEGFSYLPAPPAVHRPSPASEPLLAPIMRDAETHELIRAAAEKHQVPADVVRSIVAAESNFDVNAVSPSGAIGLMQLMPATAQQFGGDPRVPAQNIDAGTRYLKTLMERYQGYKNWLSRVIAAYNAGPGAVDRYKGVPPFAETRGYVAKVMGLLKQFQREKR